MKMVRIEDLADYLCEKHHFDASLNKDTKFYMIHQ